MMSEVRENGQSARGRKAAEVSMKERSGLTDEKKDLRRRLAMVEAMGMVEGLLSRPEGC